MSLLKVAMLKPNLHTGNNCSTQSYAHNFPIAKFSKLIKKLHTNSKLANLE